MNNFIAAFKRYEYTSSHGIALSAISERGGMKMMVNEPRQYPDVVAIIHDIKQAREMYEY